MSFWPFATVRNRSRPRATTNCPWAVRQSKVLYTRILFVSSFVTQLRLQPASTKLTLTASDHGTRLHGVTPTRQQLHCTVHTHENPTARGRNSKMCEQKVYTRSHSEVSLDPMSRCQRRRHHNEPWFRLVQKAQSGWPGCLSNSVTQATCQSSPR